MTTATAKVADSLIEHAASLKEIIECPPEQERREHERHPYHQHITLTMIAPDGKPAAPVQVQGIDISQGGMCIESRTMFRAGSVGIANLPRSGGRSSLVGVKVCHCRYFGNMMHRSGLRFIPLPNGGPAAR